MNDEMEKALERIETTETHMPVVAGFQSKDGFDLMLRQAKWLAASDLVPQQFRGNIANTVIALEMSNRMNASPLAIMQNLYIVHGKPGWSAQFIIAAVNSTGRFSPLRFQVQGSGDAKTCTAWATEKATGERLEGPPVSIDMAKKEGWYGKNGSKWPTMPDLMLRYRAATLFGRIYAPEVLMGMRTVEEIADIGESDNYEAAIQAEVDANANTEMIDVTPEPPITEEAAAEVIEIQKAAETSGNKPDF